VYITRVYKILPLCMIDVMFIVKGCTFHDKLQRPRTPSPVGTTLTTIKEDIQMSTFRPWELGG
jgi:hypothetical protein